jgi:hypothetical protein
MIRELEELAPSLAEFHRVQNLLHLLRIVQYDFSSMSYGVVLGKELSGLLDLRFFEWFLSAQDSHQESPVVFSALFECINQDGISFPLLMSEKTGFPRTSSSPMT